MTAQSEMNAQIVLRQVAPAAGEFTELHQVSCCRSNPRILGQTIALYAFQLKADPMVLRASLRAQNHRFADQIFNYNLNLSIVEQVPHGKPAAQLGDLNCQPNPPADVLERPISFVPKTAASVRDT